MRRASLILAATLLAAPAIAGPAEEARRVYAEFVAAQNAHDLERVRGLFVDSPHFLWVTNGLPVWGAEAALRRLARFHANEVWRIETDEARSRAVAVNAETGLLHVPLVLVVGPTAAPQRYRILVSAMVTGTQAGWRIAALLTTDENTGEAAP
jgi:hypothetical protein